MNHNKYIQYVKNYIIHNTPIDFIVDETKYYEIKKRLIDDNLDSIHTNLICASYTLFYASLMYHKNAADDSLNQPYHILIGDYISSYVAELLYKNKLYDILEVFAINTKQIMLNILNEHNDDQLLTNIILSLKSR
ncbi:hypothetical protein KHQ81_13620 [Mycoplasmatota bacterium]|nr:hypothetical protein KHQ81_13620 [Mycoplasmatota bacterium]